MATNTPHLNLLKKDVVTDGHETFNIETMLNENWDKIDTAFSEIENNIASIDFPSASTSQLGIVQLTNDLGDSEKLAVTQRALNDLAISLEKTAATKEEVQTLSETVAETDSKLDAAALKQTEILTGVNGVKTDTTAIKSDTTSIKADTKNILAQFPISGGVDWSEYMSIGNYTSFGAQSSLSKIYSVTGEGFVSYLLVKTSRKSAYDDLGLIQQIQVVIDDEIIIDLSITTTRTGTGYTQAYTFDINESDSKISATSFDAYSFPLQFAATNSTVVKGTYGTIPLFFKKKFEVKALCSGTSNTFAIVGGVK